MLLDLEILALLRLHSLNKVHYNNGIYLFIEGTLISAQAEFTLRALFGAMRIHSYTKMASLIRTEQSDLYMMRSRHFL